MAVFGSIPVPYNLPRMYPPVLEGGPDGESGTMTFDVALNDFPAFIEYCKGTEETLSLPGGGTTTRLVPLQHPMKPTLYLQGYRAQPFGTPGGVTPPGGDIYTPMFSHMRVEVGFASLPFAVVADQPFYTLSSDHGVVFETIPGGALVFPNGYKTTGDYGLRVGCITWVLTTYMSKNPVNLTVSNMIGKVNSSSVVTDDITFPAGTLMLGGVRSEYSKGLASETLVKQYTLKYRERSWQEALNNIGNWEVPVLPGPNLPKFQTADLNLLKF